MAARLQRDVAKEIYPVLIVMLRLGLWIGGGNQDDGEEKNIGHLVQALWD